MASHESTDVQPPGPEDGEVTSGGETVSGDGRHDLEQPSEEWFSRSRCGRRPTYGWGVQLEWGGNEITDVPYCAILRVFPDGSDE